MSLTSVLARRMRRTRAKALQIVWIVTEPLPPAPQGATCQCLPAPQGTDTHNTFMLQACHLLVNLPKG
ncbi:hypothetical protein ASAP_1117 [Asaia bogorensis]|uniref:Uncharacterized protein n=1 Tax=Asaia bogorensis TaxID=91915 RepID=A0A060QK16_9PROT|nr:hypothetical protein ASAP_1117 [Asaia bogorensis]